MTENLALRQHLDTRILVSLLAFCASLIQHGCPGRALLILRESLSTQDHFSSEMASWDYTGQQGSQTCCPGQKEPGEYVTQEEV